jgi:hypothetical protein
MSEHKQLVHAATQDEISVSYTADRAKSLIVVLSGTIRNEEDSAFSPIDLSCVAANPKALKLHKVVSAVGKGLLCLLSYDDAPWRIPLEGKGVLPLEDLEGLQGCKLNLTCVGKGSFLIVIDFEKIGL